MNAAKGFGLRLQAAIVLSRSSIQALAARIAKEQREGKISRDYKLSESTLARMSRGERPPTDWEVGLIARLLDVPESFLREGFAGAPAQTEAGGVDAAAALPTLRGDFEEEVRARFEGLAKIVRTETAAAAEDITKAVADLQAIVQERVAGAAGQAALAERLAGVLERVEALLSDQEPPAIAARDS
jgi:hypothetical protein